MPKRLIYAACAALPALWLFSYLFFLDLDSTVLISSMARRSTQAILAVSIATLAVGQQVLDLSTIEWTVTSPNFTNISVPGKLPSQAHLDLHAAQVLSPWHIRVRRDD